MDDLPKTGSGQTRKEYSNDDGLFVSHSNIKYQDCAGTCIPSGPDLGAFRIDLDRFGTAQAWITNGADSFRFTLDELDMFNGAGGEEEEGRGRKEIYRGGGSA